MDDLLAMIGCHAVRAHLLEMAGDFDGAIANYYSCSEPDDQPSRAKLPDNKRCPTPGLGRDPRYNGNRESSRRTAGPAHARQARRRTAGGEATGSSSRSGTAFARSIFRDGDEIFIQSRDEKPLNRYFPELIEPLQAQLPRALRARRRDRDRHETAGSTSTRCSCASTRRRRA